MHNLGGGPVSAVCAMRLYWPKSQAYEVITASLHYSQQDPYAVCVRFRLDQWGGAVVWYIGRDLFRDGLVSQVGEGDVRIGPDRNPAAIFIRLQIDEHSSTLTVRRRPVKDFLERTAKAVPYGCESQAPGFVEQREAALKRLSAGI